MPSTRLTLCRRGFQTCRRVFPVETLFGNTPIEHYPRAFLCAGFVAGAATDCLQCALSAVRKRCAGSKSSSMWNHCHSFISEQISGQPSAILWSLAHKRRHPDSTVYEEALTQAFQGFLRANMPMTATAPDVDWEAIRNRAVWLLTTAAEPLRDPVGVENAR